MAKKDQWTDAIDQLSVTTAEIVTISENQLLRQKQMLVRFPHVADVPGLRERCIDFLNRYGWPANDAERQWVKDPTIGSIVRSGVWRKVGSARQERSGDGIDIILREGFAQNIAWDEAYIESQNDLQEDERYLEIIFPNCDPAYADAMVTSLGVHTTEGFTVDGKERAGTWEYIFRRPFKQSADGCMFIRLIAAQPRYTHTVYENYGTVGQTLVTYAHNVPKRIADTIRDSYQSTGSTASANYSTGEGVVDMIFRVRDGATVTILNKQTTASCQLVEYTDIYYDYTKAQVDAYDIGTAPQGWFYRLESPRYMGDGRWMLIRVREQAVAITKDAVTIEDGPTYTETEQVKLNQTTASVSAGTTGVIRRLIDLVYNRFCLWSYRIRTRTAKAWEVTATLELDSCGNTETHILAGNQPGVSFPARPDNYQQRLSAYGRDAQDGTYYWHVVQTLEDVGLGTEGTATFYRGYKLHRQVYDTTTDEWKWQYANVTIVINAKQFATMAEAYAWANSGGWINDSNPVSHIGHRQYIGFQQGTYTGFWRDED